MESKWPTGGIDKIWFIYLMEYYKAVMNKWKKNKAYSLQIS